VFIGLFRDWLFYRLFRPKHIWGGTPYSSGIKHSAITFYLSHQRRPIRAWHIFFFFLKYLKTRTTDDSQA
jgi:hypothetical protein